MRILFFPLFFESRPSRHLHNSFVQKSAPSHSLTHFHLTFPAESYHCRSYITALNLHTRCSYICVFTDLRMCVHAGACKRIHRVIFFFFLFWVFDVFFPKTPWERIPLYLFVRQPDECDWQSYIIISQRLRFYPWRWYERYC